MNTLRSSKEELRDILASFLMCSQDQDSSADNFEKPSADTTIASKMSERYLEI